MLPFTLFPVSPIVMVLLVPQLVVVISAPPLNEVPLMLLAVVRVFADVAVVAVVALVAVVAVEALPFRVAVIVPALKFPLASLMTILLAVLVDVAPIPTAVHV